MSTVNKALKRVVFKIGSSSLTLPQGGVNTAVMDKLAATIASLVKQGIECVLVTSGAVAAGLSKMNLKRKPKDLAGKQATAAVGQGILIEKYSYSFEKYNLTCAQILLSRIDLVESAHYKNAKNTFERLLKYGIVPIVNENDTVVVEELCFGDNDRLSAVVAGLIDADLLILLTDVDGLYTANPGEDPKAELIQTVDNISEVIDLAGGSGSMVGTGGMVTKLKAAEMATRFGIEVFLMNTAYLDSVNKFLSGDFPRGTYFPPCEHKVAGKKRWIAYAGLSMGTIMIDNGAQEALLHGGKSLLASGIIKIDGSWERNDLVRIFNLQEEEIARGLVELNSEEVAKVIGLHSEEIAKIIPDIKGREVIHRDKMTVFED